MVIVTLSPMKIVLFCATCGLMLIRDGSADRHGDFLFAHSIKVQVEDTTGAGDSFNAGLALALACGAKLEDTVWFAVVTGVCL